MDPVSGWIYKEPCLETCLKGFDPMKSMNHTQVLSRLSSKILTRQWVVFVFMEQAFLYVAGSD